MHFLFKYKAAWRFTWKGKEEACSVPLDEDVFALEDILVVDDLLSEHFAIVGNLSPHVVDKIWLSEVVFVV